MDSCVTTAFVFLQLWLLNSLSLQSTSAAVAKDMVRILNAPRLIVHDQQLGVQYQCREASVVGIELQVTTETQNDVQIFLTTWRCQPQKPPTFLNKIIQIKLPRSLAYGPSRWNKYSVYSVTNQFLAWVLDPVMYAANRHNRTYFKDARASLIYQFSFMKPFDRPSRPESWCLDWWSSVKSLWPYQPMCPWQPGRLFRLFLMMMTMEGPVCVVLIRALYTYVYVE